MSLGRYVHALLRVGAGLLFVEHGVQKMFGLLGGVNGSGATVPLASLYGLAGALEVVGGLLLVLGAFTRPTAALLLVEMIIAYVVVHAGRADWPVQNEGELALLYACVFAFIAANGPGPLSIEDLLFSVKLERRRPNDRRHELPAEPPVGFTTAPAPSRAAVLTHAFAEAPQRLRTQDA